MSATGPIDLRLEDSSAGYEKASIFPRRILIGVIVAFGGVSILFGLLLAFPSGSAFLDRLLLAGGGVAVAAAGIWGWTRIPASATRVKVDSDGIEIWTLDHPVYTRRWTDATIRLTIRDWTSIPEARRGQGLREVQFILSASEPLEAPVNKEVADYILHQARQHRLTIVGWRDHPPPSGVERVIQIKGPR